MSIKPTPEMRELIKKKLKDHEVQANESIQEYILGLVQYHRLGITQSK